MRHLLSTNTENGVCRKNVRKVRLSWQSTFFCYENIRAASRKEEKLFRHVYLCADDPALSWVHLEGQVEIPPPLLTMSFAPLGVQLATARVQLKEVDESFQRLYTLSCQTVVNCNVYLPEIGGATGM